MNQLSINLERYLTPQTTAKSERAELISKFVEAINNEREANNWRYKKGDKWYTLKPVTGRSIAIMCSHVDMWDLRSFYAECKQKSSFSMWFFGRLRKK